MNVFRPNQHVIETRSIELVHDRLPSDWIVRPLPHDYGVDLEVEIVEDSVVTGNRIWIQLKGHESALQVRSIQEPHPFRPGVGEIQEYVSYSAEVPFLKYARAVSFPLLFVVADLDANDAFWVPIRDEIDVNLNSRSPDWEDQATATLRIPRQNSFQVEADSRFRGLRRYAKEPAKLAATGMLHAIHHELGYEADFGFVDYDETTISPGNHDYLFERLHNAETGLRRALEIDVLFDADGDGIFGQTAPLIAAAADDCSAIARDAAGLDSSGQELVMRLHRVTHAIQLISTSITLYMSSRTAWVTHESGHSQNPVVIPN